MRVMMRSAMRSWGLSVGMILFAMTVLAACAGPIGYTTGVWRDASNKVERARALEADKYSPYWWTRATTYLRMAREVAAHADFQGANRFGRLSAEAADKAAAEAEVAARDPSKRPINPMEGVAPAKESDAMAPAKE